MKQLTLLLTLATLAGCFSQEPQKTGKEGKSMPNFSIMLTDSTTWLNSNTIPTGKPIVLFYFSPYCPYCIKQTKRITEDIDKFKDINFYFISNFPLSSVKQFVRENQLEKYPNIVTGLDSSQFITDYFEIAGLPYIAIYGKDRNLNKTFMGTIYNSQLKEVADE